MLTNKIIDASFDAIFQNFGAALRIGLVPLLIGVAVALVINVPVIFLLLQSPPATGLVPTQYVVTIIAGVLIVCLSGTYAAVRWHCFSLDVPKTLQKNVGRTFVYALFSILMMFFGLLFALLVSFLPGIALVGSVTVNIGNFSQAIYQGWGHVVVNAVGTFAFCFFFLRLAALWLVGCATGRTNDSRHFSASYLTRDILHISLLYTLATFLWALTGFIAMPWFIALPVNLAISWLAFMFSISVLTEIYRAAEDYARSKDAARVGAGEGEPVGGEA